MPEKPPDFARVLGALNAAGVRYVLVGGLAMIAHGSAYITRDIDIAYARPPENLAALDDLIAMKRAAGRLKDQLHLMEMEALRRLIEVGEGRQ